MGTEEKTMMPELVPEGMVELIPAEPAIIYTEVITAKNEILEIEKTPDVIVPVKETIDIAQARRDLGRYTDAYNQCLAKADEWKGMMAVEQAKIDMYDANYVPPKEDPKDEIK